MKIAYIAAGAANMYCGSCLHDNTLAAALMRQGVQLLLIPTYTPLRTDEPNVSQPRLFMGGINVYLQQRWPVFRYTPRWFNRLLDSPGLVRWLASRGVSTRPEELGDLTVSMLQGERGPQRKELLRLVEWLARHHRPDVVHLSNSMLAGMAPTLRERLGAAIVCTLSGEDIFLEKLTEPHYSRARQLLRQAAAQVDRFVALNHYYADFMSRYLSVDRDRISVIPHGLNLQGVPTRRADPSRPFTIGYLARIDPDKGLHLLVEAFCKLCLREHTQAKAPRLRVAGYLDPGDRHYLQQQQSRLAAHGLIDRFDYVGEVDLQGKLRFLQSLDLMSVPTVYAESKGISILEALAVGVPVVVPRHGTFPELIAQTGGGLLCEPGDTDSLADTLWRFIDKPSLVEHHGLQGRQAIHQQYTAERMATATRQLYADLVESASSAGATNADVPSTTPASE